MLTFHLHTTVPVHFDALIVKLFELVNWRLFFFFFFLLQKLLFLPTLIKIKSLKLPDFVSILLSSLPTPCLRLLTYSAFVLLFKRFFTLSLVLLHQSGPKVETTYTVLYDNGNHNWQLSKPEFSKCLWSFLLLLFCQFHSPFWVLSFYSFFTFPFAHFMNQLMFHVLVYSHLNEL